MEVVNYKEKIQIRKKCVAKLGRNIQLNWLSNH